MSMLAYSDNRMALLPELLPFDVVDKTLTKLVVKGVSADSRQVCPGDLFLAYAGGQQHGLSFLDEVIDKGAVAILAEVVGDWSQKRIMNIDDGSPVPVIAVTGLRKKMGPIAARFFGNASRKMRVVGITGTNGKTSVSHFLAQALKKYYRTAVVGTNGTGFLGDLDAATHTTPDAVNLQRIIAELESNRARALAMEVSSHALDQDRVAGVAFHTAIFTNLTSEHLDYHGDMESYGEAKAKLFHTDGLTWAVINGDDDKGASLLAEVSDKVSTVACGYSKAIETMGDFYIRISDVIAHENGMTVVIESSWGNGEFTASVLGEFNAQNLVLTLAVLLSWGVDFDAALDAVETCTAVDGRMALAGGGENPHVVVDFAHTPDALEKSLASLKQHAKGKLVCVFGCGGDRDKTKRSMMGDIASRLADQVVLTDDNPRSEDPKAIVSDILQGIKNKSSVAVEHDRALAIREAIIHASSNDWVLIAGKGHEQTQQVGNEKTAFNDMHQVQQVLTGVAS